MAFRWHAYGPQDPSQMIELEMKREFGDALEYTGGAEEDALEDSEEPEPMEFRQKAVAFLEFAADHPFLLQNDAARMWAYVYQVVNFSLIIISILTFLIGTEPEYWEEDNPGLFAVEVIAIVVFTADYVLRLVLSYNTWYWFTRFLNLIDLISILPFYIEVVIRATSEGSAINAFIIVRVLRLFRVFRLFKLGKFSKILTIVGQSIVMSWEGLVLLVLTLGMALIILSSAIFYAEQTGANFDFDKNLWIYHSGRVSPFQSVSSSMWWTIGTLLTVGYGDHVPVTGIGKFIASLSMTMGVLLLAFPITVFGTNFAAIYEQNRVINVQDARAPDVGKLFVQIKTMTISIDEGIKQIERKQKTLGLLLYKLSKQMQEDRIAKRKKNGPSDLWEDGVFDGDVVDYSSTDSDDY